MMLKRQQNIGFEHKERSVLALIRSVSSIRSTSLSQGRLNGVQRLIETLYCKCSTGYVSFAREVTIAKIAIGGPVTDRTVRNWIRDAKELRILSVEPRAGQATSEKTILIDRIRDLVRPTQQTPTCETRQETVSGPQETVSDRQETVSSLFLCPPTSPKISPPPPPSTATANQEPGWERVEAEVMRELTDWKRPICEARTRVDADYVLAVVAFYRAASVFGPGALHKRLCRSHPDLPPNRGWPAPNEPSAGCKLAMRVLADCRKYVADRNIPMPENVFREKYHKELQKRRLAEHFKEAVFREAFTRSRSDETDRTHKNTRR